VEAERVKESIGSAPFPVFGDQVRVTCSIGVGWRGSQDDIDPESLLRQADSALYVAKREGRNRVATFAAEAKPIACPV
jgi:diguanylate cyclase (GGDEF)-like protein